MNKLIKITRFIVFMLVFGLLIHHNHADMVLPIAISIFFWRLGDALMEPEEAEKEDEIDNYDELVSYANKDLLASYGKDYSAELLRNAIKKFCIIHNLDFIQKLDYMEFYHKRDFMFTIFNHGTITNSKNSMFINYSKWRFRLVEDNKIVFELA